LLADVGPPPRAAAAGRRGWVRPALAAWAACAGLCAAAVLALAGLAGLSPLHPTAAWALAGALALPLPPALLAGFLLARGPAAAPSGFQLRRRAQLLGLGWGGAPVAAGGAWAVAVEDGLVVAASHLAPLGCAALAAGGLGACLARLAAFLAQRRAGGGRLWRADDAAASAASRRMVALHAALAALLLLPAAAGLLPHPDGGGAALVLAALAMLLAPPLALSLHHVDRAVAERWPPRRLVLSGLVGGAAWSLLLLAAVARGWSPGLAAAAVAAGALAGLAAGCLAARHQRAVLVRLPAAAAAAPSG
jgi:hypothetical protein